MTALPRLCAFLAAALVWAALSAGQAAAGGWVLPATPLAPSANGPSGAVVAVDPGGDAIAAWTGADAGTSTQSLLVATRPAGGTWSAPVTLARDVGVDAPAVTMDAAGNATVVWTQSADGTAYSAHASHRVAASGAWDPLPHAFPAQGVADPLTAVRADAAGDVVAAWVEHDAGGVAFVRAAVLSSGGGWSAPATLSDPAGASVAYARPQIAPDASGGPLVGWSAQRIADPTDYPIQTNAFSGGAWVATPTDVVSGGTQRTGLRLVGAESGDVAATWFEGSGPDALVGALRTGSSWAVEQVSTDVAPACQPVQALGADGGGGATVVWEPQSSMGLDSVRLTSAGWEPRVPVFPDSATAVETVTDAAVDHGTVAFVAHDVATNVDSVLASRRQGDGTWTRPAAQLDGGTPAGTSLAGVDLATDAAGDALASWTATDSLGAKSVAAAAFQAAGPQLGAVSVPAGGVAGVSLSVSASARSTFASVAQIAWSFGDGSAPVAGASASHAYAAAGTYTVTATATDSAGNATQATRQVRVIQEPPPPGSGGGTTPAALVRPRIGGIRHGVLVLVLGRGSRTLKLPVRNPNAVRLTGSAALIRPAHGRRVRTLTLARLRTVALAAGRRTTLTLRLGDSALRALRAASGFRLPVRFTLTLRAADGRRVSATLTTTLDASARFAAGRLTRPRGARIAC